MRFHVFNVVFVDDDFDTGVWETNNVLRYLENLNMAVRRQIYVVLVSATLPTMDNMQAFNKSVNLIVNKRDITSLEKILRQAMAEDEDFYRVFKETIRKRVNCSLFQPDVFYSDRRLAGLLPGVEGRVSMHQRKVRIQKL